MSLLLFASSGASCPWMMRQPAITFRKFCAGIAATLDQVMAAVNKNTARAKNGIASQAYLTVPGALRLSADLAFEKLWAAFGLRHILLLLATRWMWA